jgi:metallo-beta-lactamase class B
MRKNILILLYLFITLVTFPQNKKDSLVVSKLKTDIWNYIAWTSFDKLYYPSNGLVIKTDSGLVLIDTPVNDSLTEKLLQYFPGQKFILAIITHSHVDRIGGIKALLNKNIKVLCYYKTVEFAVRDDYPNPTNLMTGNDTIINLGNTTFEIYYPGWGHTEDNIVVWVPQHKILYGGCFIKSKESETLGNIKESNIREWYESAKKVIKKFAAAKIIIPGHGNIGGKSLLKHTLKLVIKQLQ